MDELVIYTMHGCYQCQQLKDALIAKQIPFREINILEERNTAKVLKEDCGEVIIPTIRLKGEYYPGINGFRIVSNL